MIYGKHYMVDFFLAQRIEPFNVKSAPSPTGAPAKDRDDLKADGSPVEMRRNQHINHMKLEIHNRRNHEAPNYI